MSTSSTAESSASDGPARPVSRRTTSLLNRAGGVAWQVMFSSGQKPQRRRSERGGQHSIRINQQYRICFVWTDAGPEGVEVTDYH